MLGKVVYDEVGRVFKEKGQAAYVIALYLLVMISSGLYFNTINYNLKEIDLI